jgi:hypothetical protein
MNEDIVIDGQLCAIILYASYDQPGIQFFTANELSQQLASMSYAPGKAIRAHTHNPVQREVFLTQETLFIRIGQSPRGFFTDERPISRNPRGSDLWGQIFYL